MSNGAKHDYKKCITNILYSVHIHKLVGSCKATDQYCLPHRQQTDRPAACI